MVELELSLTWGLPEALANALQAFEAKHRIRVHVQILDRTQEQRQLISLPETVGNKLNPIAERLDRILVPSA